jgi:hypothetical protein
MQRHGYGNFNKPVKRIPFFGIIEIISQREKLECPRSIKQLGVWL